jgi:DNA polymerase
LQEGKTIVNLFRKSRPKVPQAWKDFGAAAVQALNSPGSTISIPNARGMTFLYKSGTLEMRLVSGRCIYYPKAKLHTGLNRFRNMTTSVHCGHINSYTKQWEVREMTGALLFQNAIQGTCRDILVEAQINLEAAGYTQIGSIHDEGVGVAGEFDHTKTIEEYDRIMSTNPAWCLDFPISSNGYKAKRYKKD